MKTKQLGLSLLALASFAISLNAFGAACNTTSIYTSDLTGALTQCEKGTSGNDKPENITKDMPFGFGSSTDASKGWVLLDKTDEKFTSPFTITAPKKTTGSWEITSSGNSIWDTYSAVMLTFKSGNKFGDYESVLLTPGSLAGKFTISQDLSHASLWGTTAIAPVPLPAAAWLFGSALLGLAGAGYRRKLAKSA